MELATALADAERHYGKWDYAKANASATPEERQKHRDAYQQASQKFKDLKKAKNKPNYPEA